MCDVQVTVVGGGIVGCCVAAAVSRLGMSTVLLERETGVARGTTSRNSEVAHGGMYYPAGSLKADYCVRGRRLLKEFCARAGVGYKECGKLIVAADPTETPELERLLNLGRENGVEDLVLLTAAEVAKLEPGILASSALFSPRTGILDAEGAARAYARLAAEQGTQLMTAAPVTGLRREGSGWRVEVSAANGARREGWSHTSRVVVNAAGLRADEVAALAGIDIDERGWRLLLVKGNYFGVDARHAGRVNRLVYPVPPADGASLGVHVCIDLAGRLRLGPDIELPPLAGETEDYTVDPQRRAAFYQGARRFLPWLEAEDLHPEMAGVRPKLALQGFTDFVISREEEPWPGLINLIGIDSPGLTSAPAIAEQVAALAAEF